MIQLGEMTIKFHSSNIVTRARELRKAGLSIKEIAMQLKLKSPTISRWCNDIPVKNAYHLYIKNLEKLNKDKGKNLKIEITPQNAKLLAGLLYWCEGSKYPASNFISFANSDQKLVGMFLKLFRLGFRPEEKKLKVHLQLHTTHDTKAVTSYWSQLLKIPKIQFYKPTVTRPTKNMKRLDYMGTCAVRYYDVSILWEMTGIFENFSSTLS